MQSAHQRSIVHVMREVWVQHSGPAKSSPDPNPEMRRLPQLDSTLSKGKMTVRPSNTIQLATNFESGRQGSLSQFARFAPRSEGLNHTYTNICVYIYIYCIYTHPLASAYVPHLIASSMVPAAEHKASGMTRPPLFQNHLIKIKLGAKQWQGCPGEQFLRQ